MKENPKRTKSLSQYWRGSLTNISEKINQINPYWGGFESVFSIDKQKAYDYLYGFLKDAYKNHHIQEDSDYSCGEKDGHVICKTFTVIPKNNLHFRHKIQLSVYKPYHSETILD